MPREQPNYAQLCHLIRTAQNKNKQLAVSTTKDNIRVDHNFSSHTETTFRTIEHGDQPYSVILGYVLLGWRSEDEFNRYSGINLASSPAV